MKTAQPNAARRALQCMEICGSNRAIDDSLSTPGLDIWIHSKPYHQADSGGDVHYVSLCGGGVTTRFILADVSGHGSSVSEMARALRDLMRRNINRKKQSRLVNELNRQFTEMAKMRRFATALIATYLTTHDSLTISNAGHPRPLWYQASTGRWSILAGDADNESGALANLPLGIDETVAFTESEVALGRGDWVLFYTDALTEATNRDDKQLGEVGLVDLVQALDLRQPGDVAPSLVAALEGYCAGKVADDDLTFLLLHHHAGNPKRLKLAQKLDVYAKVFGLKKV